MPAPRILLQLDPDPHPSVFDSVVAVDAGVEQLFRHGGLTKEQVRDLVHGCMFTRGGEDLKQTAIFVGGSQIAAAETLFQEVLATFFGPVRLAVLFDGNGCNTTAAAAIIAAGGHVELNQVTILVLGGTGPVGQRVAKMGAICGAKVKLGSRQIERAEGVCAALRAKSPNGQFVPVATDSPDNLAAALNGVEVVIAAGATGIELLAENARRSAKDLRVAIDLNAVPPVGLAGIKPADKAKERDGVIAYGALGVGGTKMKIHKAAIQRLFTDNTLVLDAAEVLEIGRELEQEKR